MTSLMLGSGQVATCTFATGPSGSASCSVPPPPPPGTVIVMVDEPAGNPYYPGFCKAPGMPVLGSPNCSDGRPATILFGVPGGSTHTLSLPPGPYNTGMARLDPPPTGLVPGVGGVVTVVSGQTQICSFTLSAGPVCFVDDGDGVNEPGGYDGNGDGTPDDEQVNVTSLPAAEGGETVTIAAPSDSYTLTSVSAEPAPADLPPGVDLPLGVFGFSVNLPEGVASADVMLHLPAGTNPASYFKRLGDDWVPYPNATISGDVVTLHLVDNDAFDTDPTVGVIGDPGGPVPGFLRPITMGAENAVKAGQTIPVKWRLTDGDGAPVSDPASVVGLASTEHPCDPNLPDQTVTAVTESSVSGLRYLGDGYWQFNWSTNKSWKGQCRRLTLALAGGTTYRAEFRFK
jgi:hypothetical protein